MPIEYTPNEPDSWTWPDAYNDYYQEELPRYESKPHGGYFWSQFVSDDTEQG